MPVLAPERLVIEPLLLHRQDMSKMPLLMTAFEAAMLPLPLMSSSPPALIVVRPV